MLSVDVERPEIMECRRPASPIAFCETILGSHPPFSVAAYRFRGPSRRSGRATHRAPTTGGGSGNASASCRSRGPRLSAAPTRGALPASAPERVPPSLHPSGKRHGDIAAVDRRRAIRPPLRGGQGWVRSLEPRPPAGPAGQARAASGRGPCPILFPFGCLGRRGRSPPLVATDCTDLIPAHPHPHPEVPERSAGLEGGLRRPRRSLEPSFEAASRHLRMRKRVGASISVGLRLEFLQAVALGGAMEARARAADTALHPVAAARRGRTRGPRPTAGRSARGRRRPRRARRPPRPAAAGGRRGRSASTGGC